VKARTVSFYIDPEFVPQVLEALDTELIPQYREVPHFVGLVVLESEEETGRPEFVGISVWDGDRTDCDDVIEVFLSRLFDVAGTSATTRRYDVVRLVSTSQT
jgi:hypothetical protein